MFQTSIRSDQISEADLAAVVANLGKLTGKEIKIDKVFIVSTEDVNLSTMIDSLAESLPVNAVPASNGKTAPKTKRTKKSVKTSSKAQADTLGPRSVRIVATGEVLSSRELKQRLANNKIDELTTIENGNGKRFVVIEGKLAKEPEVS